MEKFYLVGDIGGTNSRFAIVRLKKDKLKLLKKKTINTNSSSCLSELVLKYLGWIKKQYSFEKVLFAIAGSTKRLRLTNSDLKIDIDTIRKSLEVEQVEVINDFEACAYAVPILKSRQFKVLNRGDKSKKTTKVVIGAGTGLGKAIVFYDEKSYKEIVLPSEGGHSEFVFVDGYELKLVEFLRNKLRKQVIEQEDLLSGRGLENIYEFFSKERLSAEEISKLRYKDEYAKKTFDLFYKFYARVARDFALDELAIGGVYLAGGIVMKNMKFSKKEFIKEFVNNQTYSLMLSKMRVCVIKDDNVNLYGLMNYIKEL